MDDRSITNRELLRVLKAEGRVAWSRFATKALVTAVVVGYLPAMVVGFLPVVAGCLPAMVVGCLPAMAVGTR